MTTAESLKASVLFAGLTPAQATRLASIGSERSVAAGETIFKVGTEAEALFIISKGAVELTFPLVVMGESKEVRFQSLEAGRALAWSALIPPHILTMSARAANDVTLVSFTRPALLQLWEQEPVLGLIVMSNVAKVISTRLATAQALWVRDLQRQVTQVYG